MYSVGIHPWRSSSYPDGDTLRRLEEWSAASWCVAIGECGVDTLKGGPIFRQLKLMKIHIEFSERLAKPLIIHDVKAHDIIIGLHKDMTPTQPWIIHGFRGKPSVAEMFLRKGFYLSFGELFNAEALKATPSDRILAETDESTLPIDSVIARLSDAYGSDLSGVVQRNAGSLLLR